MKYIKQSFLLFIFSIFAIAPVWAGGKKTAIVKAGEALFGKKIPKIVSGDLVKFNVGKLPVYVPKEVVKIHNEELQELFFNARITPPKLYPTLSPKNDLAIVNAVNQFSTDWITLQENLPEIGSLIKSKIFDKSVPYKTFFPQDAEVIYLGEVHSVPSVQGEIQAILESLPKIYPGRKIYLAAEAVPVYRNRFSKEEIVSTWDELDDLVDLNMIYASTSVLKTGIEQGFKIVGLEDELALLKGATPLGKIEPTDRQFGQYVTSFEGMRARNAGFARRIRALKRFDPDALIVVYGGMDHFAYHQTYNLPKMVGGKSFVVQIAVPAALSGNNPLFRFLREEPAVRNAFRASPDAKLVEWWGEPTRYNRLLGNDLTIIVHE